VRTAIQVQIQWIHTITVQESEKKKDQKFSQGFSFESPLNPGIFKRIFSSAL
jgi:hypothetical protein